MNLRRLLNMVGAGGSMKAKGGGAGGFGISEFIHLNDAPHSYAGKALNIPQVNAGATALEFIPGRGQLNGVASLDGSGKVPDAQLPALAISDFLGTVGSQAAMLLLVGQPGDWCIRSDLGTTWIVTAVPSSVLANWQEISYPSHAFGGSYHAADTVANIQTKVSDGSFITSKPGEIAALTAKASPVGADLLMIEDSADSNKKKKIISSNLPVSRYYLIPIISVFDNTLALPVGPAVGDRYIAKVTANGWTIDHIYEWNGSIWIDTAPVYGMTVFNNLQGAFYTYEGGIWFNLVLGAPGDHSVLADIGDPAAGYLDVKVDNSTIDVSAAHVLEIKNLGITDGKVAAANKDGAAATPSMRTIGPGALQACAGNDPRLSDSRTPTAHALAGALHSADTITNLNTKLSDGSLITSKAAEISAIAEKTAPIGTDLILIEDSADTNKKKRVQWGNGGLFPRYVFFAENLNSPNNADWHTNALAPANADSLNNALIVRQFDDTAIEGAGFTLRIPAGATNINFMYVVRAQTAPGGNVNIQINMARRIIRNNTPVGVWGAFAWPTNQIPANTNYQFFSSGFIALSVFGALPEDIMQCEFLRINPIATPLVGDLNLLSIKVNFT